MSGHLCNTDKTCVTTTSEKILTSEDGISRTREIRTEHQEIEISPPSAKTGWATADGTQSNVIRPLRERLRNGVRNGLSLGKRRARAPARLAHSPAAQWGGVTPPTLPQLTAVLTCPVASTLVQLVALGR